MAYLKVSYCYAHEDEALKDELDKHLTSLKRQDLITTWHIREILAGEEWKREEEVHLEEAHFVLLLISSDFLSSDSCYYMMSHVLKQYKRGGAEVIPILLRPVEGVHFLFNNLPMLPTNRTPVTGWSNRDEAFSDIAREIRSIVTEYITQNILHTSATYRNREPLKLTASIAELYTYAGSEYFNNEQYQEALLAYEQAIGLYPSSSNLIHKGDTLVLLERNEEAAFAYEQAIHNKGPSGYLTLDSSKRAHAYQCRGDILYKLKLYREALDAYNAAILNNPSNIEVCYYNRGLTFTELNLYGSAIKSYNEAIRLNPNYANAYYHKSLALKRVGKSKEAREALKIAQQLGYKE